MKEIPDLRSKFNVAKKQQGWIRMGRDNLRLLYLFLLPTKISLTVKLPGFHFSNQIQPLPIYPAASVRNGERFKG